MTTFLFDMDGTLFDTEKYYKPRLETGNFRFGI